MNNIKNILKATLSACAGLAFAGCCFNQSSDKDAIKVVSPDGHNEIRLYACEKGVAYEVVRDGVVVVAKSRIGMKVDGVCLAGGAKPKAGDVAEFSGQEAPPV